MQWRGEVRYAHGAHNSKGVLIAFKDGVNVHIRTEIVDSDGRFIIIQAIIDESNVVIVNYYTPNDEPSQVETSAKIDRHIRSLELEDHTTFLFGGNFNMYFDTKLDADGGNPKLKVNSLTQLEVGETGARCNNFAFELHNFLSKENKPKQNITFGSPFS